jgi:hypothetical protein
LAGVAEFCAVELGICPFGIRQRGADLPSPLALRSCGDPVWDGVVNVACSTPEEND